MHHFMSLVVELDAVLSLFCERVNAVARMCRADMQHSSPIEAVCCYGEKTQFRRYPRAVRLFLFFFSSPLAQAVRSPRRVASRTSPSSFLQPASQRTSGASIRQLPSVLPFFPENRSSAVGSSPLGLRVVFLPSFLPLPDLPSVDDNQIRSNLLLLPSILRPPSLLPPPNTAPPALSTRALTNGKLNRPQSELQNHSWSGRPIEPMFLSKATRWRFSSSSSSSSVCARGREVAKFFFSASLHIPIKVNFASHSGMRAERGICKRNGEGKETQRGAGVAGGQAGRYIRRAY